MSDNESVEYLQPGFDPAKLTVPRLRGILVAHNVQYSSAAKKPQLIDLFNEHVVPQSKKILAARARVKRMSRGIVDADSQESVHDDQDLMPPPTLPRARSPRKSTRLKSESVDPEPEEPLLRESPRKRQSRSTSAQPVGVSDIETSTDVDTGPRSSRKPRRDITATTPPIKLEPPREDSFFKRTPETEDVFSSDNPFQSGGSSPPAPEKTPSSRRKTTGPEPTKFKTPSNRRRTDGPFDSDLYRSADQVSQRLSYGPNTPQLPVVEAGEEFTPEAQLELQQEEAANPQRALLARPKLQSPTIRQSSSTARSALLTLLFTVLSIYAAWYRQEKIAVGYCGLGRPANPLVPIPENVDVPDWAVALVEPPCEPCPPHAICYEDFSVRCEQDFVIKPHPLSLGGLVPLPPTCEPDGEKVRRVQAVADRAVEELRDRRAKYECGEPLTQDGSAPVDSPVIDEDELRETLSQKRSKRMSKDEFDDLWTAAIGEIKARDEVEIVESELEQQPPPEPVEPAIPDVFLPGYRPPLSLAFRSVLAVLSALYGRSKYRSHRKTAAQIPVLVDIVLERLAAQKELAFEEGGDDAFLFLPNLRDDVLRNRHKLAERERIWAKVRAVVEQNSNVRTGQREGRNGEVGRAWEWIGPSSGGLLTDPGGSSGRRRKSGRVSWGPDVKDHDGEMPLEGKEVVKAAHKSWEESRPIY